MNTFSLLLASLDQKIDRHALEEASTAAPSVARADCPRLQREQFGILASQLPENDALAFQAELKKRNHPTDLVADRDLPTLHESLQIQRIERRGEVLILTDSIGRERVKPMTDLVFLAAGFLNRLKFKTEWHQHVDFGSDGIGMPKMVTERESREESELEFRLDFFFWTEPRRLHVTLGRETAMFHQGNRLRLRDADGLREMMSAMARLLPAERLNACLRDPDSRTIYPNLPCYEKEIRWHFHRLTPQT